MNLVFILTCLEPGRDGVGDYTHALAEACARRGHQSTLIALNDRFVDQVREQTLPGVTTIRLPQTMPWAHRQRDASARVQQVVPDWVSWQMVPYGFHPKGFLPAALLRLARSWGAYRHHIMVHELWIGLAQGEPWRARVIGAWQRRCLLSFLRGVDALVVQTSNRSYAEALRRAGLSAQVLPLFGNIPIVEQDRAASADVVARFFPPEPPSAPNPWLGMTFGTLHPQWNPAPTVRWTKETAAHKKARPKLLLVGRTGPHRDTVLAACAAEGVEAVAIGEQTPEVVSRLLQSVDYGIAPHPWALIGKSGVAAAMRDHGLPVLVPRDEWRLPGATSELPPLDPLFARLSELSSTEHIERWLQNRRPPQSGRERIAHQFLESLQR